ncbi:putative Mitogen-activated protein kinase 7 [Blattamonas nauphoetae]|uniref:Mitogen-activated protein kinase n=1 Tax=Blattamonas nauphoetae TaxID=2049346 RepID=A0ABQ9YBX7_9EUKA|nr:putative Mitogen-activated protein kinase 7 [Blattamonas nauphoetae]
MTSSKPTSYSFTVPLSYSVKKLLGKGTYGVVCAAVHETTKEKVAIKKIADAFLHTNDMRSSLRELRILTRIKHDNIITCKDIFKPESFESWKDLYWVSELMDSDLHRILSSTQPLAEEHIQFFLYQTVCGLRYLHSAGIMHRDLKPANLLVNRNCDLKICDLGLACAFSDDNPRDHNFYVQTRWYRAPELLIGNSNYDYRIDIWSLGICFAEMYTRKPVFRGSNYMDQLKLYYSVLVPPTAQEINLAEKKKAREFIAQLPPPKYTLASFFKAQGVEISADGLNLLNRMLQFDPAKRITLDEMLRHPYLLGFAGTGEESLYQPPQVINTPQGPSQTSTQNAKCGVVLTRPLGNSDYCPTPSLRFDYEDRIPKSTLKHLIFQEMLLFHTPTSIPQLPILPATSNPPSNLSSNLVSPNAQPVHQTVTNRTKSATLTKCKSEIGTVRTSGSQSLRPSRTSRAEKSSKTKTSDPLKTQPASFPFRATVHVTQKAMGP